MTTTEQQIQALHLFDTLVEFPAAEREFRFLALAQSDAAPAQAVQLVLDADAVGSGLLDYGVQGVARTVLSELYADESLGGLHAGIVIGSFALLRPLGQGGMGEVWLAERRAAQADGDFVQQVALKLHGALAGQQFASKRCACRIRARTRTSERRAGACHQDVFASVPACARPI